MPLSIGREEEARTHPAEILRINPNYSVQFFRKPTAYKNQTYLESLIDPPRKAGLPEVPPLAEK
jgi:hypothetical protein